MAIMITSIKPPSTGLKLLGPARVMGREADEPHLAGFLDGGDGLLHLLALGPVHLAPAQPVVEIFSSQRMKVKQVDVIGPERLEPQVNPLDHVAGPRNAILGGEEDLGTHLRHGREPFLESTFGSIRRGRVKEADAAAVRKAQ